MSIPVSQLVNVLPGVLAAAGTTNSLNGLLLSTDTATPLGTVQSFPSASAVGAFYGLTSPEYLASQVYFAGPNNATKTPAALLVAQYPTAAVSAYLRSAQLTLTLAQLQALSGILTVTVGGAANTSSAISLSGVTSFTAAAALIQAAFTAPAFGVTWDAQRSAFVFKSTATGAAATAAYATGTLATGLSLTLVTGAVLSQGAVAAVPGTFMANLVTVSQAWAGFATTFEPVTSDKTAFSAWVSAQGGAFFYAGFDSDPNVTNQQGATSTWGYAVTAANYGGSHMIVGTYLHAAFVLGWAASTDFTLRNGRSTLAYRQQSGMLASISDQTAYQNALANGYNCYGAFASKTDNFLRYQPGSISGAYLWMDSYINQIWLRANLQSSLLTLLSQTGTIPYNTTGKSLIQAAVADPVTAAINFGAIAPGVVLSTLQVQELTNAVGFDISGPVYASGWYLQVSTASSATRVARGSPPITFFYTDGQSVQTINLSAIEVQ